MILNNAVTKLVCMFWLTIVTPIFGILPIFIVLRLRPTVLIPFLHLDLAILSDFWNLFYPDPALDVSDAGPPLSTNAWWLMITITLGVALLALYCFCRSITIHKLSVKSDSKI